MVSEKVPVLAQADTELQEPTPARGEGGGVPKPVAKSTSSLEDRRPEEGQASPSPSPLEPSCSSEPFPTCSTYSTDDGRRKSGSDATPQGRAGLKPSRVPDFPETQLSRRHSKTRMLPSAQGFGRRAHRQGAAHPADTNGERKTSSRPHGHEGQRARNRSLRSPFQAPNDELSFWVI